MRAVSRMIDPGEIVEHGCELVVLELPAQHAGSLGDTARAGVETVEPGRDDGREGVGHRDRDDLGRRNPPTSRMDQHPTIDERLDHLFDEVGVAFGLRQDELADPIGKAVDVEERRDQ